MLNYFLIRPLRRQLAAPARYGMVQYDGAWMIRRRPYHRVSLFKWPTRVGRLQMLLYKKES